MSAPAPARTRRRGLWAWAAFGLAVVVVGFVGTTVAAGSWSDPEPLDPESAGPSGARALVSILGEQGVEVTVARDLRTARSALDADTTLVIPDAPFLSDAVVRDLAEAAGDVVLIEPRSRTLDLLLPGSTPSGSSSTDETAPSCEMPAAERAGGITAGSLTAPGGDVTGCYPSGEGFALLVLDEAGHTVSAIDARTVFANDSLDLAGNASLALSLTGAHPAVLWYMPTLADADVSDAAPSLGELTPEWVTPVMVLLTVAALAAALWRGRRFGALVVENLPVTVRAGETTTGRARLYARARDAGHALDQLRLGSLERIGRMLGLPAHADPGAIADAAAGRLQADRAEVRGILQDFTPRTDRELVELAERLRDLEARVHAAARPERNTP